MEGSAKFSRIALFTLLSGLAACSGGRSETITLSAPLSLSAPSPLFGPSQPPAKLDAQYLASAASPFAAGCDQQNIGGTAYLNAEVEPYLTVNPLNPNRLVGTWQQDRWSNGSARGLISATSLDGGQTWTRRALPFSRCGGGTVGNGGDYARVTDPWVSYGPNGTVYATGLANSGVSFQAGSSNAILVSRSLDDGLTWSNPATLIRDGSGFFNDKEAVTADPTNANLVYVVWDRLVAGDNGGPAYLARSTNGGASWEAARPIYDPGNNSQTIGNLIVVLPDGALVNLFLQIDYGPPESAHIAVVRSFDKGATWTAPRAVAELLSVGTRDPNTGIAVRDASILPQIAVAPNGTLYVAWQDSRFESGALDSIVISRSLDDGNTWTPPQRVSTDAGVAAFNHALHVRHDGMIGVTYYDFRSDGAAATLMTDVWLARSSDGGATWAETRISDPFDLAIAPRTNADGTGGYFVGDYQGLVSRGDVFLPFFSKANNANTANRTDIFLVPALSAVNSVIGRTRTDCGPPRSRPLSSSFVPPEVKHRIGANLQRARQQRLVSAAPATTRELRPHFRTP